jgi:phosphoribosylaminoimidazole carboxylase
LKNIEHIVPVFPRPATIERIKDKYIQKLAFQDKSLPTPSFAPIDSLTSLKDTIAQWGGQYPVILKSRCNAYDGRGNFMIRKESDLEAAIIALTPNITQQTMADIPKNHLYLERVIPYAIEVSVMVAKCGKVVVSYPLVESLHVESILRVVSTPTRLPSHVESQCIELAKKAVDALCGDAAHDAGIFGVEMFVSKEEGGKILLNEIAPRPHNSGHYTLMGTSVSQFESHLRAVLGLPISDIELQSKAAVMLNILGQGTEPDATENVRALLKGAFSQPAGASARASVYFYQKYPWKKDRKIGHINITGQSVLKCYEALLSWPNVENMIGLARVGDHSATEIPLMKQYIESGKELEKLFTTVVMPVVPLSHDSSSSSVASSSESDSASPLVGVIMGSDSDLPKMKAACEMLERLKVPFEVSIVSAHRTPERLFEYAKSASTRGILAIIAGAGGAAHLPGMVASMTPVPVIGVPILIEPLLGLDSLLSIVQMPGGIPVATVAINNSTNAALLAVRILSTKYPAYLDAMVQYQAGLESVVLQKASRLESMGWKEYKPM